MSEQPDPMKGNIMDVIKALAVLAESGIDLTSKQKEALADFKRETMNSAALAIVDKKVHDEVNSSAWVTELFTLAHNVSVDFVGSNVSRGRGEVHEKVIRIDTPDGTLKVSLTTDPQ